MTGSRYVSKATRAGDIAGTIAQTVVLVSLTVTAGHLFRQNGLSLWWIPLAIVLVTMASLLAYLVTAVSVDVILWRHRARIR